MKKVAFLSLLFFVLLIFFVQANSKPVMVISTISYTSDNNCSLYPEIAVDENGIWREATINDIWHGQKMKLFDKDASIKNKKLIKNSQEIVVEKVNKTSVSLLYKLKEDCYSFGVYYSDFKYKINSDEKTINMKPINQVAKKYFVKSKTGIKFLNEVLKSDLENINKDFKKTFLPIVKDVMIGDVNGDGCKDYILIIGSADFQEKPLRPVAIIVYVSYKQEYQRISLDLYEKPNDEYGWPKLLFIHDFNGDKKEEIFIGNCDSDTTTPIVYSWFGNGIKMIYYAEKELN